MTKNKIRGAVAAAATVVVAMTLTSGGGANAAGNPSIPDGSVTTHDLAQGTILQQDVNANVVDLFRSPKANSVWTTTMNSNIVTEEKLSPATRAKLNAPGLSGVEADGPYPGATKLQDFPGNGSNSTETVPADNQVHGVWVKCADGKTALGGGFRLAADAGTAAAAAVQVVASEPLGEAIAGDAAGSIKPVGWTVEVINSGTAAVTVRPWVTCAKVS